MRAFLIAVLLLLAVPTTAQAQSNPFTGKPAQTESEKPAPQQPSVAREPAKPGIFAQVTRQVLQWQRKMNQALAVQMRGIRDSGREGSAQGSGQGGTFGALLLGMGLAFLYGAFHVAGPGHGKAVIVSYFLGREARLSRGLWLGAQIAATHVVAAIALVWIADAALRQAFGGTPAELRFVQAASYAAIIAIGLHMLWQAVQRLRGRTATDLCAHEHHHGHEHEHDHGRERARQGLLSFAVGLVPCTGATLVMLYALANGILYAGIVMVLAIGLGMAAAMAIIGVATILARRAVLARAGGGSVGWAGGLQLLAGLAIALLGTLMLYAAIAGGAPAL